MTSSDLSHRYLWQPDAIDQLLADERLSPLPPGEDEGAGGQAADFNVSQPGSLVWPLADQQGTIRDLAVRDPETSFTTVANHRVFDAFGNLKSQTDAAVDCLFAFTGRPLDKATALQNNLNRWYDARTGQWMSKDPVGFTAGDTNTSRYCENSPANAADPNALAATVGAPPGAEPTHSSGAPFELTGKAVQSHVRFDVVQNKWAPLAGCSPLNNHSPWDQHTGAPRNSRVSIIGGLATTNVDCRDTHDCNTGLSSGVDYGRITGYVTNLPAGTYDVGFSYDVRLSANTQGSARATVTNGAGKVLFDAAASATTPLVNSNLQYDTVRVTVGAGGEALVVDYHPYVATWAHAGLGAIANAIGMVKIRSIARVSQ